MDSMDGYSMLFLQKNVHGQYGQSHDQARAKQTLLGTALAHWPRCFIFILLHPSVHSVTFCDLRNQILLMHHAMVGREKRRG